MSPTRCRKYIRLLVSRITVAPTGRVSVFDMVLCPLLFIEHSGNKKMGTLIRSLNFYMKRRSFVRNSALAAFAISNSGFIRFEGNRYVGDCETTTDILGPFYRPNGPLRTDLVISGEGGTKVLLEGVVKHSDCVTPFKKAKIELWHCDATGVYDNTSDEFRYRGTTYSDQRGRYFFNTILPVPYSASDTMTRPAHFHMMITAGGYQQLITQLYFEGDKFLNDDSYASSASAGKEF